MWRMTQVPENSLRQALANLFCKGPGFVSHSISVTTTQLCPCSAKAPMDDEQTNEFCVPVKVYL